MSLVEEIQASALDRSVPVVDLLRRVKLAAAKLKLTETHDWVESELNGYRCSNDDMPSYRSARGQLMITTAHHGTYVAFGDPETIAVLSLSYFRDSMGSLESLLSAEGGYISIGIDLELAKMLQAHHQGANYSVRFSKNVIVSIVDAVRNLVLDWAIKLEAEGILGEGVSFTMEEKKKAAEAGSNIYVNLGHHHQGDTHGSQNRTTIGDDNSSNEISGSVFEQLATTITNNVEGADREVLLALIKKMEAEQGKSGFKALYTEFVVSAANHMTVVAPFLPALTKLLPA